MAPNEIDLRSRPRSTTVVRWIGHVSALLVAAGCLATLVAGPGGTAVRLLAGAVGLLIVVLYLWVLFSRPRMPARLEVDHEGIRVWDGRGTVMVRLAWPELSGVGVMTNEAALRRQLRGTRNDVLPWVTRRIAAVQVWLELYPANAETVARHPELEWAWSLGRLRAPGEEQRWLVTLGAGRGQLLQVAEAVQRRQPQLWRGHRAGSALFGGEEARRALRARGPRSGHP